MNSTARKIYIIFLICLTALTLAFIWGNSMLPPNASIKGSSNVYGAVVDVVENIAGTPAKENFIQTFTHQIFRKFTHFAEFGLLGLELSLLFIAVGKFDLKYGYFIPIAGVAVALIDEFIQIFSKRGSSMMDVLIDVSGFLTAFLFVLLVVLIINKIKSKTTA